MLRVEGLSTGYSARPVLNGVSINVEAGQFVAIVSASPMYRRDGRCFRR
jgi:ABC-type branched-subunit amino acid transport system ATPase component